MFKTGIVLHYVSEYSKNEEELLRQKLSAFRNEKVLNPQIEEDDSFENLILNLPIGTTICKVLKEKSFFSSEEVVICLPMFSSHISLPVKENEVVWFIRDDDSPFDSLIEEGTPLLAVRHYWLSRKIGLKTSEDLNYSFYQRDTLITNLDANKKKIAENLSAKKSDLKKTFKNYKDAIKDVIELPDYDDTIHYKSLYEDIIPNSNISYEKIVSESTLLPAPVPRWHSKHHELTLQGSNNTLINLTNTNNTQSNYKSKGAIDIVSGRHMIDQFYVEENKDTVYEYKNKIVGNLDSEDENKNLDIKIRKNSFAYIRNTKGDTETLKNQRLYLSTEDIDESPEGKINLDHDASRLYISEFDNVDNALYYDATYFSQQTTLFNESNPAEENNAKFSLVEGFEPIEKDFLEREKISRNNLTSDFIEEKNLILPAIFAKSNNIRLVARKRFQDKSKEEWLNEGSIRLIKESENFFTYSHMCLEDDGQVAIDGSTILLGNFKKELLRQEVAPLEDILEDNVEITDKNLISMHGNGHGVLIGYEENIAEPLVLGNSLESMLKELIHINLDLLEELNKVSNNLLNHTHSGVTPGGAVTQPASAPPTYSFVFDTDNFVGTEKDKISNKYQFLRDNLHQMLSRFAKTT